jgi:murein DD-endopeptidase MepM/ murein hydrolase activator NlpD
MALPLLGAAAKGLLSGAGKKAVAGSAKKVAAKKFVTGKKKNKGKRTEGKEFKDSKVTDVGKEVKAKVKPTQKKVATVKLPANVYKDNSETTSSSDKNVSFESLGKQLDNINKTTSQLASVATTEEKVQKEKNKAVRAQTRKDKLESKEKKLEGKEKGGGILGGIMAVGNKFNIFNFLTNVALGGLALLALNNIDTITNILTTLTENFTNPLKLLKGIIVGISTAFAGPIKVAFKTLWKGMKASGTILKKSFKKITPAFKKLFGGIGKGLVRFVKGVVSKTKGLLGGGAKGAKGAVGTVAAQKAKAASQISSKAASQAAKKGTAKNILGKGGKRILEIGGIFKKVPVIGGMLGIIIDLLLGEPLDRAIVGAIGGGIGAWIGGGIGSLVFPFAGTAAGAILGGMIGYWAGNALYGMLQEKMGLIPPVDPKDRVNKELDPNNVSGTGLNKKKFEQRSNLKIGQIYDVKGKKMVWNGLKFVNPQQYQQQTGKTPTTSTSTSSPSSSGSGSAPSGYTSNQSPSSNAQGLYGKLGITSGQWKTYKDTLASIETSGYGLGESYKAIGGSGDLYDGRYQMGDLAKKDAARILGIPVPSRQEFRNNPQLQEDMILAYTYANHTYMLGKAPTYDQADGIERLTYLGFGHNQGWSNAVNWLNSNKTKDPTRDGFGTSGTKFTNKLRQSFGAQSSQLTPQMQQTPQVTPQASMTGPTEEQMQQKLAQQQQETQQLMGGDPRAAQLAPQQRTIPEGQQTLVNKVPFEDFSRTSAEGGKGSVGVSSGYKSAERPGHTGIDIGTQRQKGYYVALKADGKVTVNQHGSAAGNMLFIKVGNLEYVFMHLASKSKLKVGDSYTAGTPIGEIGNTGRSFGEHLHFEVRPAGGGAGTGINPKPYLKMLEIGKLGTSDGTQTQQVEVGRQQTPNQGATVSSRPSYDPQSSQSRGGITPIPIPDQQQSGGGGGRAPMMGGPSTQQVLNSYYKSQLMGFLYKQG